MTKHKGPYIRFLVLSLGIDRQWAKRANLSYYAASKPCKVCGGFLRLVSGSCVTCKSEYGVKWRENMGDETVKEYMRDAMRRHRSIEENRLNGIAKAAEWKKKNNWKENPQRRAEYIKRNIDKILERRRAYFQNNKEAYYSRLATRRALENGCEGYHTPEDRARILAEQQGMCAYCYESDNLHLDHKHPISRGGSNWPDNLQYLCAYHNLSKNARTDEEYRAILKERGFNVRTA